MTTRTFTAFQVWLESQVANGVRLSHIAGEIGIHPSQLTRLRKGSYSFPKRYIERGLALTGLSLAELLQEASPAQHEPAPVTDGGPVEPATEPVTTPQARDTSPPSIMFEATPDRVHLALQHGLKFGTERAAFCATRPEGDLDTLWGEWCAQREAEKGEPEPSLNPDIPPEPALYDHLKRDIQRPNFGGQADTVGGVTPSGSYRINIGHTDSE